MHGNCPAGLFAFGCLINKIDFVTYIKNYNWDKTKKLESALIKAIPKFNLYSTLSSNEAKKTYAQAEEYLTLPSVFYRDRTMGELSVDEQDEEYNVLE